MARQLLLKHGLSKYNNAPMLDSSILRSGDKGRILVIDQTRGDLSISLGGAKPESFTEMLALARQENPEATIYVKTHPEVSSGRKGGHLCHIRNDLRTVLLNKPINPFSLLVEMDRVYVVTSTMGFEALLAGKPVTVLGLPWYAGWGVTDDRQSCARRGARRTVDELFAAAYIHYARYLNPTTAEIGTIFDGIDWLATQREAYHKLYGTDGAGRIIGVGLRRWKRASLAPLLSPNRRQTLFVPDARAARNLLLKAGDKIIWWGNEAPLGVTELADESGAGTMCMEDGFIRSVGLGSDLIAPLSLVLDGQGLYFDPRRPSDLETLLATIEFSEEERERARNLRNLIAAQGISKYNMEPRAPAEWTGQDRRVLFVPGQVEDDASIRFGCSDVRTNHDLLRATREAAPDAFIVYKPHPDVLSGNRKGRLPLTKARKWADHIENRLSVISCIEACDEVHTMTSLSGFDALLREKSVVTYGQPFYAGWGLTLDKCRDGAGLKRRQRWLTLDELVAGTLLRYPLYWDPDLKGYTSCEAMVHRVVNTRYALENNGMLDKLRAGYVRRQWRKLRVLAKACLALPF
ncbi:capsular polysaccharide export protein [Rhizorhapis suberifaciens]|uniref:Capsular polysaccharide export protein n=1 Tax=Rhizorhapis suberifaciens TaxID=13656 RepID=A0A840HR18_9SPHN|nr:capsular polysaccharide export protein [Rhizorhapis suberifaciens]